MSQGEVADHNRFLQKKYNGGTLKFRMIVVSQRRVKGPGPENQRFRGLSFGRPRSPGPDSHFCNSDARAQLARAQFPSRVVTNRTVRCSVEKNYERGEIVSRK